MDLDNWFIQPSLPKFDGTNFKRWKIIVQCFLESQDLWNVVENCNYEKEYGKEEFRKRDIEVLSYIFQAVDLSLVGKISTIKTAREAWRILSKIGGEDLQEDNEIQEEEEEEIQPNSEVTEVPIWKEKSDQNHQEDQICEEYVDDQSDAIQANDNVHNNNMIEKISVDEEIMQQSREEVYHYLNVIEDVDYKLDLRKQKAHENSHEINVPNKHPYRSDFPRLPQNCKIHIDLIFSKLYIFQDICRYQQFAKIDAYDENYCWPSFQPWQHHWTGVMLHNPNRTTTTATEIAKSKCAFHGVRGLKIKFGLREDVGNNNPNLI